MDVARLLIEHGADAAAQSKDGTTPLHQASEQGDVDVAQLLIKHGADAAARSKDGATPLHRASLRGHVDVAQLLIEHGADAADQNQDESSSPHLASEGGHHRQNVNVTLLTVLSLALLVFLVIVFFKLDVETYFVVI